MNWVSGCEAREVAALQAGRPDEQGEEEGGEDPERKADRERFQRALGDFGPRWTIATQRPAIGPNSGPTTIPPMIRIGESR